MGATSSFPLFYLGTIMTLHELIPTAWQTALAPATNSDSFRQLETFLQNEWNSQTIFPPKQEIFSALNYCSPDSTRVVIFGQDPYHGIGQAHGLSFSVKPGVKIPPSLNNMYKELVSDLQISKPETGNLVSWAGQGVLLLNAVLTVREASANSHQKKGWETFTDAVIEVLNQQDQQIIFVLWGKSAQAKKELITNPQHKIIESVHPSPLSAHRGFFGSKPFSKINQLLTAANQQPIDWAINDNLLF